MADDDRKNMNDDAADKKPDADDKGDNKVAEVDWTTVDPATIPHDVASRTPFGQGTLRDLQESRQQAKELSQSLAARSDGKAEEPADPTAAGEDDSEIMTRGEAKAMVRQARKTEQDRLKAEGDERAKADVLTRQNQSYTQLQAKYPADKVAKGLDAATVIHEGGAWLRDNKPALFQAAMAEADPAQAIYDLATAMCPAVKQRASSASTSNALDSLHHPSVPRGAGGIEDSLSASSIEQLIAQPEDQLLKDIDKAGE